MPTDKSTQAAAETLSEAIDIRATVIANAVARAYLSSFVEALIKHKVLPPGTSITFPGDAEKIGDAT